MGGHHPETCPLRGNNDPPRTFGQAHLASEQISSTSVLFFVGDTQTHNFKSFSGGGGAGVTKLVEAVLGDVLEYYPAEQVVCSVGNNDGPHYAAFKPQDDDAVAWAQALLSRKIVTDDPSIVYSSSSTALNAALTQTEMFAKVGFNCKAVPRIADTAYAVHLNAMLGGSNAVQQEALKETLDRIYHKHGDQSIVYIFGHMPSVVNKGIAIVDSKYRSMAKGVFAGHVHFSTDTTSALFTQVGGVTQGSGNPNEFHIARVPALISRRFG